jgi:hypothetical protein
MATITEEMRQGILEWLCNGERGVSSEAMAFAVLGMQPRRRWYPLDPSDFNRCFMLIERVPEIKAHFDKVAALSPEWAALIARWEELEAVFVAEAASGPKAPKTYSLMQEIIKGVHYR